MKYAKWKAVEIDKCLKAGVTPTPGPPGGDSDDLEGAIGYAPIAFPPPSGPGDASTSYHPPLPPTARPVPKPRQNIPDNPGPGGGQEPSGWYPSHPHRDNPPEYDPTNIGFPSVGNDSGGLASGLGPPEGGGARGVGLASVGPGMGVLENPPVIELGPGEMAKAQKLAKFAASSLDYEDVAGAIDYLSKALSILKTGKEKNS